jgi:SAM-dependent methyltransferase
MPYTPFANQEYRNIIQTRLEIPTMLRLLPLPSRCRILEVGCGRGVALPRITELCEPSRLVGLDIDPNLILLAQERVTRCGVKAELRTGDVRRLPFGNGEFDVVFDFGTCYHIEDPDLALLEIARVLDVGGYFVHETPLAQLMAHPVRTSSRELPWQASRLLTPERSALLWACRRKLGRGAIPLRPRSSWRPKHGVDASRVAAARSSAVSTLP